MPNKDVPSRAMLAAIGQVANECSNVEETLRDLYCHLIDSPCGHVILAGESLNASMTACLGAARYNASLSRKQLDQIIVIFQSLKEVGSTRNYIVHSRWVKLNKPGLHYGVQSRRATTGPESAQTVRGETWSVPDVVLIAEAFEQINSALGQLIDSLTTGPYAYPMRRNIADRIERLFSEMLGENWSGAAAKQDS
ncbi:hypothetical protein [Leifsonia sp. 2MCAF36]|uniref:hypothetical protein n=1 Tax=Leifsonia sp. 2MCAF36 TaxID=3232988 RepID=UPI003F9EA95A